MPMIVLSEEQAAAGLSAKDVDLATILRNHQVDKDVQAVLATSKSSRRDYSQNWWARRKWSVETLGLDSGSEDSVRSAALTEAWSASRNKVDAETRA